MRVELSEKGQMSEGRPEATGKAPVILLHGFAQTPRSWDGVAVLLRQRGHSVLAPDLFRRSGDSLERLCGYVAEIVRNTAAAEGAPVLVGYSMGGRIAAETVVRHSNLPLAGLILESAGLGPVDGAARAVLAERNAAWARRLREEGVAAFMDWWETLSLFATQQALPAVVRSAIRVERTSRDAEPLARSLEAWGAHRQAAEATTLAALAGLAGVAAFADRVGSADSANLIGSDGPVDLAGLADLVGLANRGIPVLYLAGSCDEKYAAAAARVCAAGLPAVLVPDAGHNVHLEAPVAFMEVIEGVLEAAECVPA